MDCVHCGSKRVKKNGISHTGKQNHYCNDCGRQFLEGGQEWFVSDSQKELIDKLLLERISLAGIVRVVGVSDSWLLGYIRELYGSLPEDLGADDAIPDLEEYLADRMDEEISRIEAIKKIRVHFRSTRMSPWRKGRKGTTDPSA